MVDGQKYAHTIDPFTGRGYNVYMHGCRCMGNSFMVMGPEKSIEYAQNNPELEAYFIYDLDGISLVAYTSSIEDIIKRDSLYFRFLRFLGLR